VAVVVGRRLLQRLGDPLLDLLVGDRAGPARPRIIREPLQAFAHEPAHPLATRLLPDPQLLGDLLVARPLGTRQHDLGAQRQRLRGLGPPGPAHKRLPLVGGQYQGGLWSSSFGHDETLPHLCSELTTRDTSSVISKSTSTTSLWS